MQLARLTNSAMRTTSDVLGANAKAKASDSVHVKKKRAIEAFLISTTKEALISRHLEVYRAICDKDFEAGG